MNAHFSPASALFPQSTLKIITEGITRHGYTDRKHSIRRQFLWLFQPETIAAPERPTVRCYTASSPLSTLNRKNDRDQILSMKRRRSPSPHQEEHHQPLPSTDSVCDNADCDTAVFSRSARDWEEHVEHLFWAIENADTAGGTKNHLQKTVNPHQSDCLDNSYAPLLTLRSQIAENATNVTDSTNSSQHVQHPPLLQVPPLSTTTSTVNLLVASNENDEPHQCSQHNAVVLVHSVSMEGPWQEYHVWNVNESDKNDDAALRPTTKQQDIETMFAVPANDTLHHHGRHSSHKTRQAAAAEGALRLLNMYQTQLAHYRHHAIRMETFAQACMNESRVTSSRSAYAVDVDESTFGNGRNVQLWYPVTVRYR